MKDNNVEKGVISAAGKAVRGGYKAAEWWGKNPYRAGVAAGVMGSALYVRHKKKKKLKRKLKYVKPYYAAGVTMKVQSIIGDIIKFADDSDIIKGGKGSGWTSERGHLVGSQGGRKLKLSPAQAKKKPTFRIKRGERVARGIKYIAPGLLSRIKHIASKMQRGFMERGVRGAAEGFILARRGIRERKLARLAYYGKKGLPTPKEKKRFENLGANLKTVGTSVGVYAISQGLMGAVDDMARGVQETIRRNPYAAAVNVGIDPNILQAQAHALYDAATGKIPAEEVTGPRLARYINRRLGITSKASPLARTQQLKERVIARKAKKMDIKPAKLITPSIPRKREKLTVAQRKKYLGYAAKFKTKYRAGATKKLLKSITEDLEGMGIPVSGALLVREDLAGKRKKRKREKKKIRQVMKDNPGLSEKQAKKVLKEKPKGISLGSLLRGY